MPVNWFFQQEKREIFRDKNSFKALEHKALKELQKVNRPSFFNKEIHVSISKQRLTFRQSSYNIHFKKDVVSDNESEVCYE